MSLKTIIIDDEQSARNILQTYLEKYCPEVDVKGIADGVKTGIEEIKKHQPDLVFLDIEMPYGNGFDLLEQLEEINFQVIFVTAYSEYAIKALNMSASYYLLKPLSIDDLVIAVEKVANSNSNHSSQILLDNIHQKDPTKQKILLPTLDGFEVININEITHLEANDNFTEVYLEKGSKLTICRTLKQFEELLSNFSFVRTHRSFMVNTEFVVKYSKGNGGFLTLTNGAVVNVSPSKKEQVLQHFMKF